MVASETLGMGIMALVGTLVCSLIALSENGRRFGLHFFYLYGVASVLGGLILVAVALHGGHLSQMSWRAWKCAGLLGTSGAGAFILKCMAVALGAPLGDTSALSCINVVLAALLGRAFLGEALRSLHVVALLTSIAGALLISMPESLFGTHGSDVPIAGYAMALASGIASGFTFIAARRAQDVNPIMMTASVMLQEGIVTMVIPVVALLVDELPTELMLESPLRTAASVVGILLLAISACGTTSLGSQMCPAAASSTICSATSVSLGYALQALLYDEVPELVTCSGALLMLLGVLLMAWAQKFYGEPSDGQEDVPSSEHPHVEADTHKEKQDDTLSNLSETSYQSSLASFAASEKSGVRLRPSAVASSPNALAAQTWGFAGA